MVDAISLTVELNLLEGRLLDTYIVDIDIMRVIIEMTIKSSRSVNPRLSRNRDPVPRDELIYFLEILITNTAGRLR